MDTTYWGRDFGVLIMKDSYSGYVLWYKFLNHKETLGDYGEGIHWLEDHGYDIQCIVSDGLKGLRQMFSQYKFQLCQFHQMMNVRKYLTLRPKLEASKELLKLSNSLCSTTKESFIKALAEWESKWTSFCNERAVGEDGKTHYIHKDLRSAWYSLKHNMPVLWTWYDNQELHIPNTNNGIESLNSDLKTKLSLHRGLSMKHRMIFIQEYLQAHQPKTKRKDS